VSSRSGFATDRSTFSASVVNTTRPEALACGTAFDRHAEREPLGLPTANRYLQQSASFHTCNTRSSYVANTTAASSRDHAPGWLPPVNANGGSKARLLRSVGYRVDDPQRLERDLRTQHLSFDITRTVENAYNVVYEIEGPIEAPSGRPVATGILETARELLDRRVGLPYGPAKILLRLVPGAVCDLLAHLS
jgi:hypothetical protein